MAARSTRLARMKRSPSNAECNDGRSSGSAGGGWRRKRTRIMPNIPTVTRHEHTMYAKVGLIEYRNPDDAGPTIKASVKMAELRAIILCNVPSGATIGGIDLVAGAAKARAIPKPIAMRKIGPTAVGSVDVYHAKSRVHSSSPAIATTAILRRL